MNNYSEYNAGEKEALEYQAKIILFTLGVLACFAAYATGVMSLLWMTGLTSVMVTRWMIAFHELMHLKQPEDLNFFIRLLPIPFAPLNLGYREYQKIHMGHHKHTATTEDPDAFHILGGFIKALVGALTQHEQACYRYIRTNKLTRELAAMMLLRLCLFVGLFMAAPLAFLTWWLVLRLTYIINDFVFFHLVHYRSGHAGTFAIPLPAYIVYPALFIYGPDVVYATMHHNIHHKYTRIAPKHLPLLASEIDMNTAAA